MNPISSDAFQHAVQLLSSGQIVAIPTETVYGLAANALDPEAVARIFAAKGRPADDPLIVHVRDVQSALAWTTDFPEPLMRLAEAFWPGPLTVLVPKSPLISDAVTSGLPRVALRAPSHPVALALLEALDFPLAAPSANPFGYVSPTTADHVRKQLADQVPLILDGGPCQVGVESTIVGMENGEVVVYRLGGIALEQLQIHAGRIRLSDKLTHAPTSAPTAPGMLLSHYAPQKPVFFGEVQKLIKPFDPRKVGVIVLRQVFKDIPRKNQKVLAIEGDLGRAARGLFAALRELDEDPDVEVILAHKFPAYGLGAAINDRLKRAAARRS